MADLGAGQFSSPLTFLHPPEGYRSCHIGNFEGPDLDGEPGFPFLDHAREHHWKLLSRGPTADDDGRHSIDVVIGAFTVNSASEAGSVRATAIDAVGIKVIEVTHPSTNGLTNVGLLTLVVDEGVPYDLVIENPEDPESGLPPAKHYSIGATRPYIEIGYGAPCANNP